MAPVSVLERRSRYSKLAMSRSLSSNGPRRLRHSPRSSWWRLASEPMRLVVMEDPWSFTSTTLPELGPRVTPFQVQQSRLAVDHTASALIPSFESQQG